MLSLLDLLVVGVVAVCVLDAVSSGIEGEMRRCESQPRLDLLVLWLIPAVVAATNPPPPLGGDAPHYWETRPFAALTDS